MIGDKRGDYYRILEVDPRASLREIHNAYIRLKKLYSESSIVLDPLSREFSDRDRGRVLIQVEEAYAALLTIKRDEAGPRDDHSSDPAPESGPCRSASPNAGEPGSIGSSFLRSFREKTEIDLDRIAGELKLRTELLRNLEEERFEALPEEIYIRSQIKGYALILGLDPSPVIEEYLRRYRAWKDGDGSAKD